MNNKKKKNKGKEFEKSFEESCPDYLLIKRLNDNASAWSGGEKTRFASNNECDYILFNDRNGLFYGLELKTTETGYLTFWREDFEKDGTKSTFQIKKSQILGLSKWSKFKGVFGFIINFRDIENHTFFVDIKDFLKYTSQLNKKRINIHDVLQMNPININSQIKRVKYKYDIDSFLKATEKRINKIKGVT